MPGGTFVRRDSASAPHRCLPLQSTPPQPPLQQQLLSLSSSQQSDGNEACRYLYRHRIHAKVESIFSSVLKDRPEDPLLYIVEHLRNNGGKFYVKEEESPDADSSTSIIVGRRSVQQTSEYASTQRETPMEEAQHDKNESVNKDLIAHKVSGGETPLMADDAEVQRLSVTTPVSISMEADTPLMPYLASNKPLMPWTDPFLQPVQAGLGNTKTGLCLLRPHSSLLAPRTSVRSSRNDISYGSANFRYGSTMTDAQLNSVGATSLDRDDSTRSDLSALSLVSVDMQDFLQEFRSAKADCVGAKARLVDIEMLLDILQRVNLPFPDVSLIAELFDEVKRISDFRYDISNVLSEEERKKKEALPAGTRTSLSSSSPTEETGSRERVYFDAFLARMAFMIHGRYPTELIRGTFYSILESAVRTKCSADGVVRHGQDEKVRKQGSSQLQQQQQQQQELQSQPKGTGEEGGGQHTRTSSGNAFGRSSRVTTKNMGRSNSNRCLSNNGSYSSSATHTYPGVSLSTSALCAAPNKAPSIAELSTLLHGVPLAMCVEEGLWRGLGIPVSKAEVMSALCALGIPSDDSYEFHVNDFVRLVMALTGPGSLCGAGDRGPLWVVSSVGRENSLLPFSGSSREDSA